MYGWYIIPLYLNSISRLPNFWDIKNGDLGRQRFFKLNEFSRILVFATFQRDIKNIDHDIPEKIYCFTMSNRYKNVNKTQNV